MFYRKNTFFSYFSPSLIIIYLKFTSIFSSFLPLTTFLDIWKDFGIIFSFTFILLSEIFCFGSHHVHRWIFFSLDIRIFFSFPPFSLYCHWKYKKHWDNWDAWKRFKFLRFYSNWSDVTVTAVGYCDSNYVYWSSFWHFLIYCISLLYRWITVLNMVGVYWLQLDIYLEKIRKGRERIKNINKMNWIVVNCLDTAILECISQLLDICSLFLRLSKINVFRVNGSLAHLFFSSWTGSGSCDVGFASFWCIYTIT